VINFSIYANNFKCAFYTQKSYKASNRKDWNEDEEKIATVVVYKLL